MTTLTKEQIELSKIRTMVVENIAEAIHYVRPEAGGCDESRESDINAALNETLKKIDALWESLADFNQKTTAMNDIDKVIRRLDHWIRVWEYLDAERIVKGKGIKYLQDAVAALRKMQAENIHLLKVYHNQRGTMKEYEQRIEELERLCDPLTVELYREMGNRHTEIAKQNKRLDAALAEMECLAELTPLATLGTFTEHIRKARAGTYTTKGIGGEVINHD